MLISDTGFQSIYPIMPSLKWKVFTLIYISFDISNDHFFNKRGPRQPLMRMQLLNTYGRAKNRISPSVFLGIYNQPSLLKASYLSYKDFKKNAGGFKNCFMFQFFNLVAHPKIEENGDVNKRLVGGFKYVLFSPQNLGKMNPF